MSIALKRYFDSGRGRQARAAEHTGYEAGYLSQIANGQREASVEAYRKIAAATGIPISALLDDPDGPIAVPVVSFISAGALTAADAVAPHLVLRDTYACGLPRGDWIAFEVEGTSMNRISPPGSTIFVNRAEQNLVPNACYVIANHDGSATYKRYRPDPDRFEPVSTDDEHAPIFVDNTPGIVGRVRRSVLEM